MRLQLLYESSTYQISGALFPDLKKIYQAHALDEEPDRIVLNRVAEVMVRFLTSEIERTEAWLSSSDPDTNDWANSDGNKLIIEEIIRSYIKTRDGLKKAWHNANYKRMSAYIDNALSLQHYSGAVWDNLELAAAWDPEVKKWNLAKNEEVFDELTAFLRSIGRFPRTDWIQAPIDDRLAAMKKAQNDVWRIGPGGKKINKRGKRV